ncbi:MAG: cytochrome b/b6 domain-containing protein [Gammaproteobacteria bacterium]
MTEHLADGRQDSFATLLGALIFAIFTYLFYDTITIPTTPLDPPDARLVLRAFHYTLGISVWVLVAVRLYWWWNGPRPTPPPGLPPPAFAFSRAILLALFLTFFVTAIIGAVYAYADGQPVSLYGIRLPTVLPESYPLRAFGGYFHSAFGFYYLGLVALWLLVGIYQHVRYRAGLMRLLPGSRV